MQYYYADAQSKEKTFTAPQFGLSMKYPSDWTFIRQEQDLSSQLYDDSMVLSSGVTNIGDFCPSSEIEDEPELFDCQIQSPAHFGITAYKLKPGTNLKELSNQEIHTRNISYQKKLNEIIEFYIHEHLYPDTVIRAIAELHSIELSISNLFKNLPSMHLEDDEFAKYIQPKIPGSGFEPWDHPKGIQCSTCGRWMMNKEMLKVHDCLPEPVV